MEFVLVFAALAAVGWAVRRWARAESERIDSKKTQHDDVQFVTRERKLWGQVADEPSHTITITIESSQTSDTDAHPGEKVETKDNFESFPFAGC